MTAYERFELPTFVGELAVARRPADLAATVARVVDPGQASDTVHWGRNYLYGSSVTTDNGAIDVVVKQFRNQGLKGRVRRRIGGSKAQRHWRFAKVLAEAGIGTPEPVLCVESREPAGPSFLVTGRVDDAVELRYYLRSLNAGTEDIDYPELAPSAVLEGLGAFLRRVHDAGVWHRDVSVGNLLVGLRPGGPTYWLLDLNRARRCARIGVVRRTRDLCRLRIFGADRHRVFLRSYWGRRSRGFFFKGTLFALFQGSFLARNRAKKLLRAPFAALRPRTAHAHIPAAPAGASARDRVVWDALSDQPHQHASRLGRLRVRAADMGAHAREAAAMLAATPRIWRRYRRLAAERDRSEVPWRGTGVALRPWPAAPEELLRAVEDLGVECVYLRLDTWSEAGRDAEEALARELAARGYELTFGLPQDRDLVRDGGAWERAVADIADRFAPFGGTFQVGQAINRSKWGVWKYDEYRQLLETAAPILRRARPDAVLLGPAVIDFEAYATAAVVNMKWPDSTRLDALASLLYVDRRGAPENPQLGFDTIGKVTLMKAIAETARNCGPASWITEVNWPLREGPHAPAGRSVAVDEETQADYLVRFYLLALGTGLVERVFWWQLVSRGYGLICPEEDGTLRRRPAFRAFATLQERLAGATFLGPAPAPEGAYAYRFRLPAGGERWAVWSVEPGLEVVLPRRVAAGRSRDGSSIDLAARRTVVAGRSVTWLDLGAAAAAEVD